MDDCDHPQRKRRAYAEELTDAQLKFLFHSEQVREKMKQDKADNQNSGGGGANQSPSDNPDMSQFRFQ